MKTYTTLLLIGLSLFVLSSTSFAALDWHIRWDEAESPTFAKVYIFNPEDTYQTFHLEIGDIAKTATPDSEAPYLIVGQDVSRKLAPSERQIFDIIVYRDIDPASMFSTSTGSKTYQLSAENYRFLQRNYDSSSPSRQYPISIRKIEPRPKDQATYTYRSGRGYWKIALTDHDHVIEQLIRTGDRLGASHTGIQQAIFYYTQGTTQLSDEALEVWETAFPELAVMDTTPTPPAGNCTHFVTLVATNLSYYSSSRTVQVGDVLAPRDATLSPVVAAQDVTVNVAPNAQNSKQIIKVYLMYQTGQPSQQSEYVSIVSHHAQIERAIRIGDAEQHHPCAIQDVVFYLNNQVATPTTGKNLWDRLNSGAQTPVPPVPTPRPSLCLGGPSVQPQGQAAGLPMKNVLTLVGAVIPLSLVIRRRRK